MKRLGFTIAGALALGFIAATGSAHADQGSSVIESKKSNEDAITMDGKTYRVSESTALEDKDGNRIAFDALPSTESGASQDDAAVWFESSESEAREPILHRLKLTGGMPR